MAEGNCSPSEKTAHQGIPGHYKELETQDSHVCYDFIEQEIKTVEIKKYSLKFAAMFYYFLQHQFHLLNNIAK